MRLNKFLRDAGVGARRKVDQLIQTGHVRVNGRPVREPWHQVDPEQDLVTVDQLPVRLDRVRHYLKLYKPRGVTTTLSDRHAERTLMSYVPTGMRLFPVGRLDRDSEGLVLLTDDGELAYRLTHPRFRVPKRYRVTLDHPLTEAQLARLRRGLWLEDGPFRPTDVRRTGECRVELTLCEGRKREIRRGFARLGRRVRGLVRLSIGPVGLESLRPGEVAPLTAQELRALGSRTAPFGLPGGPGQEIASSR